MTGGRSVLGPISGATLILFLTLAGGARCAGAPTAPPHAATSEFASRVRPLLRERCSPCHFPGGRVHDELPFDREETVRSLGKALFTRLKDPEARAILEAFLQAPTRDGER